MNRQEANIKIATFILQQCEIEENKDQRFQQLIFNLGINEFEYSKHDVPILKDKYNEESVVTLSKLTL